MREDLYKISDLIYREFLGELSGEERDELFQWVNSDDAHRRYYQKLFTSYSLDKVKLLAAVNVEDAWRKWDGKNRKRRYVFIYSRYAAVFVLLLGVAAGFYLWESKKADVPLAVSTDIGPGKAAAVLLIEGKEKIVLGESTPVDVRLSEGVKIEADSSNLYYKLKADGEKAVMHTLEVPRRGEFFILLSDSTRVWVNSETRLRYPSYFESKERIVELDGEAYFEVHPDRNRPFVVRTGGLDVEVLGTSFNVSSYGETSDVVTTLVSGKVKVKALAKRGAEEVVLLPGMQSSYDKRTGNMDVRRDVDIHLYTAWMRGFFMYDNVRLEDMMRDICRWYNVDVVYVDPEIKDLRFTGEFKRYDRFDLVLKFLQLTKKVKADINGNVIYLRSL